MYYFIGRDPAFRFVIEIINLSTLSQLSYLKIHLHLCIFFWDSDL